MNISSTATVWEFKEQAAQQFGLGGKYIKIILPDDKTLYDNVNGMTLSQITYKAHGEEKPFTSGISLIAERLPFAENIEEVDLVTSAGTGSTKVLTA